jgi:hypothetical protein
VGRNTNAQLRFRERRRLFGAVSGEFLRWNGTARPPFRGEPQQRETDLVTHTFTDGEPSPPLPETDTPLMMNNPVLTRTRPARQGRSNLGWYVGVPVAVVAVGALAFVVASNVHQQPSLTTTATDTTTTTTAAAAPAPAPAAVPAPAPPPAQVATASPTETPVAPPAAITPRPEHLASAEHHAAIHRAITRHATDAGENAADVSATAPMTAPPTLTPPPPAVAPAPPAVAPAPVVITPPPS